MTFEELVKKTLTDTAFRDEVKRDPRAALISAGLEPTDDQVAALKGVDGRSMTRVVHAFSPQSGIDCGGHDN